MGRGGRTGQVETMANGLPRSYGSGMPGLMAGGRWHGLEELRYERRGSPSGFGRASHALRHLERLTLSYVCET